MPVVIEKGGGEGPEEGEKADRSPTHLSFGQVTRNDISRVARVSVSGEDHGADYLQAVSISEARGIPRSEIPRS